MWSTGCEVEGTAIERNMTLDKALSILSRSVQDSGEGIGRNFGFRGEGSGYTI